MELFRKLPRSLKSNKCLGIGLWGSSKPLLSLLMASRLLVFTAIIVVGQLIFKVTMELVVGFETEWIKTPQSLLYLQRLGFFSCVSVRQIPPVLIFRMLTKLILTILDSVLTIFMEERFSGVFAIGECLRQEYHQTIYYYFQHCSDCSVEKGGSWFKAKLRKPDRNCLQ